MSEKSYVGLVNCFFCGESMGVAIHRNLRKTLPYEAVYSHEPCDKCKEYMKQGIIILSVRDGESGENPYRTGGFWVVTEDFVKRLIGGKKTLEAVLECCMMYMEDSVCEKIGLVKVTQNEYKKEEI